MAFKLKSRSKGRPSQSYKLRRAESISPRGFDYSHYSTKHRALVFKRKK